MAKLFEKVIKVSINFFGC